MLRISQLLLTASVVKTIQICKELKAGRAKPEGILSLLTFLFLHQSCHFST